MKQSSIVCAALLLCCATAGTMNAMDEKKSNSANRNEIFEMSYLNAGLMFGASGALAGVYCADQIPLIGQNKIARGIGLVIGGIGGASIVIVYKIFGSREKQA